MEDNKKVYQCVGCEKVSTAKEWNDSTHDWFGNGASLPKDFVGVDGIDTVRKLRDLIKSPGYHSEASLSVFKCPSCGNAYMANELLEIELLCLKYGEKIKFIEDREIVSCTGEEPLIIKKGDMAFVGSFAPGKPSYHFMSGKLYGKELILNQSELEVTRVEGYHTANIAGLLLDRLKWQCNLTDAMDEFEISDKEMTDAMEDLLSDILG